MCAVVQVCVGVGVCGVCECVGVYLTSRTIITSDLSNSMWPDYSITLYLTFNFTFDRSLTQLDLSVTPNWHPA